MDALKVGPDPDPPEAGLVEVAAGLLALVAVLAGTVAGLDVAGLTTGGEELIGFPGAADVAAGGGALVGCRHCEYHGFCSTQVQPEMQVVPPVQLIPPPRRSQGMIRRRSQWSPSTYIVPMGLGRCSMEQDRPKRQMIEAKASRLIDTSFLCE